MTDRVEWPCKDIRLDEKGIWWFYYNNEIISPIDKWILCPICGAKRPEEKSELDLIFEKHDFKIREPYSLEILKKDLEKWRDKNADLNINITHQELLDKKEEPKALSFEERLERLEKEVFRQ